MDDTEITIALRHETLQKDVEKLQYYCDNVIKWFEENDLQINPEKTQLIGYLSKKNEDIAKSISINILNTSVAPSDNIKALGLIKDKNLQWIK